MKKLIFILIAFFGMLFTSKGQNVVKFSNQTERGVVGTAHVTFDDNSTADYNVGGPGVYTFQIGSLKVSKITIGNVVCELAQTVTIPLSNGGTATESLVEKVQDESRSFNSIIR